METLKELFKRRTAYVVLGIIGIFLLIAIFAPWISPYDPYKIDVNHILEPPSFSHPFGTDLLGRDLLSRIFWGIRISLEISFLAVGISVMIGILLGAFAGYFGGWIDEVICRFIDIMLCFPAIFLILAVVAYLEPSVFNIMIVIGLTSWMGVARLVRAEVLSLKEREFIVAARLYGASSLRIIFRHLLPNALPPVLVAASFGVGDAIIIESALSFLGIGIQPPTPSLGNILFEAKEALQVSWWLPFFPGFIIFLLVLSFILLGEELQKVLS